MSSEARRRANARNAQRSTGPRSREGKARASGNARRHGLNTPVSADPAASTAAVEVAKRLLDLGGLSPAAARQLGELVAHVDRIRQTRQAAITRARASPPAASPQDERTAEAIAVRAALPELLVLDGYERKALSRLRRLLRVL